MDALLSLPVLGYFMMPGLFASYSTSLNLLFFYMTWSTLVLSHSPLKVEILGTLGVRLLFFLIPSTLFLLFDTLLPSLTVGIKTQGASALPTRTGGRKVSRRSASRPEWYQVVGLSIFNVCLGAAIQAAVEVFFTEVLNIRSALKVTTTLPMPWSILKDIIRGLLLRETLQYYIHRFVLHPNSANFVSDLHTKYFHSITAPYAFAVHYDHPLPYILLRVLPVYLPSLIFREHLLTHLLFLSLVTLEETLTFSGYTTMPGIMLGGLTRRQDLHSASKGKGNFAPWGLLDWIHGTSIGQDVIEDLRGEADKHQVKERGNKVVDSAKESGRAWNGRRKSRKA
ncbi:sterol desaturase family protein [Phlyctema vagabunda]|uniref:Sterol desaturase family protein n=1 Tax=Phlyctema vagabunda TaxID=108571 RepID=A0ABR4PX67_9HELO